MSDSIVPSLSAELLVRMSYNIDFKDKILKLMGSAAKVSALSGSPQGKDFRAFASQLSAARSWMKFLKIIRSTPDLLNPARDIMSFNIKSASAQDFSKLFLRKAEFVADIVQMLAEDVSTLHRGRVWSSGLRMKPISNISVIEQRAWWVWSLLAALNSYIELKKVRIEYDATPDSSELKIKYYLVLFKFVKFACEVVDASIALTPDHIKTVRPGAFELVSIAAGSVSAISSLHKLLYTESIGIALK